MVSVHMIKFYMPRMLNSVVEKLRLLRKENRKSLYVTVAIFVLIFIIYMLMFSE